MAKRFTDTEKWDDPWFTELPDRIKLFWIYICDKADLAGVWKVHKRLAEASLGGPVDLAEALALFGPKRIQVMAGGERWRVLKFVEFQYGKISSKNPLHKAVSKILEGYELDTPTQPLPSGPGGPQVKVRVKEREKEQEGGVGETKPRPGRELTDYFWQRHLEAHQVKPQPPKWTFERANRLAQELSAPDLKARVDNYFADPFLTSHPFEKFVTSPDTWKEPRKKLEGRNRGIGQGNSGQVGKTVSGRPDGKFTGETSGLGDPLGAKATA
jgi:hypothetical protein